MGEILEQGVHWLPVKWGELLKSHQTKQHQTQSVQVLAPLGRLLARGAEAFYALDAGTAKCRFDPGKMGEILKYLICPGQHVDLPSIIKTANKCLKLGKQGGEGSRKWGN